MGIVLVAFCAARPEREFDATMTSTLRPTNSLARAGNRSIFEFGCSDLYDDVLTIEIPEFAQSLTEGVEGNARLRKFKRPRGQVADPRFFGLLRPHGKRPHGRCAAKDRD